MCLREKFKENLSNKRFCWISRSGRTHTHTPITLWTRQSTWNSICVRASGCLLMCIALTARQINTNLLSVFICNDHKCNTLRVLHSYRIAYRSRRPDKHWNSLIPFWIINGKMSINCTVFNNKMPMLMRDQNANWPVFVCRNCGSSRGIKNVKRLIEQDEEK